MSQQTTMTMPALGGPVNAINANTPNHAANNNSSNNNINNNSSSSSTEPSDNALRLNTYIYDYFVRNQHYECARVMLNQSLPIGFPTKTSPDQRQTNGVDDMDMDSKDADRPKDLPLTDLPATGGYFLEDWWVQFWDVFNSRRSGVGKPSTIAYLSHQRQLQKSRSGIMGSVDPIAQRNISMINGGGPGAENLKKMAMVNNGNMNPHMMQAAARARAQQNMLQSGQMERQGSQMDARSGSPGSGGAPSPKRPRVDGGNMQHMVGQPRPGQPGQMPTQVGLTSSQPPPDPEAQARTRALFLQHNIDPNMIDPVAFDTLAMQPTNYQLKSLESYNASMQQQMTHAMKQAQASSNMTKGMPPNAAIAAALQAGAPVGGMMPQGAMDVMDLHNERQGMLPNNGVSMSAQAAGANNNGSHALQDYQMQLMLLEQQNKRRLMMARGEQDTIGGHTGVPAAIAPNLSPSGRGGPSPNPADMSRGTPKMINGPSPNGLAGRGSPAPNFDPNVMNAQLRNQLMLGQNGGMVPRSNPMQQQNQLDMLRAAQAQGQMLPNGTFAGAPGMPPNMMPGQPMPGQQPGQVPPGMTPRQNNMPPPPAPQANAAGTQPSSPAPPVAPPTPSQTTKAKPGSKKDAKAGKGSNKKNANAAAAAAAAAATPASEAEQPPTPTPQTPMNAAKNFNQNQAAAMANGGLANGQVNGGGSMQQGVVQSGQPDIGVPPFNMDASEQFMISDFSIDNSHDVLDNFDFDAFLQNTGDDGGMPAFEYDFANVGGVEAGDSLGP